MSRSDLEIRLARMWADKLNVSAVGVDDNFFELGGDSLIAVDLLMDVYREFGCEVDAWVLFVEPTIAQLTSAIIESAPDPVEQ